MTKCSACPGVAHPSTGCQYTEKILICGPCVRRFWEWAAGNGSRKFRVGPKGKGATYIAFPTGVTASAESTTARASTPAPPRSR